MSQDRMDPFTPSAMLINFLELLEIYSSEFKVKLHKDIFKNPDKELFRKIMCFLVKTLGGFEEWVEQYSRPIISAKVEAQFRLSIKDIVAQINTSWPKASIKVINQSFFMAPQGAKIVSFLLSVARITVIVAAERASGEEYIPPDPADVGALLDSMKADDCSSSERELENRIEELKSELEDNIRKRDVARAEYNRLIDSDECDPDLRADLKVSCDHEETLQRWKQIISEKISEEEKELDQINTLNDRLLKLKNQLEELSNYQDVTHLDGFEILKELGFKSNQAVQLKGIELVQDHKLNLLSLFNIFCLQLKEFLSLNVNNSRIDSIIDLGEKCSRNLDAQLKIMEKKIAEFEELLQKYKSLIDELRTSEEVEQLILSNELLADLYLCEKNKVLLKMDESDEESPFTIPEVTLPVSPDKLAQWILKDSDDDAASVRKSKCIRGSPASALKSARKLKCFGKKSDKSNEGSRRPIFNLAPLIGLNMDNRRATLASPQMAKRERFKYQHIDSKRKPLKALFTASSPLSESRCGLNEKTISFGEQSKVDTAEECILNLPSCSYTAPLNSPKARSLITDGALINSFASPDQINSSDAVISTPELQKWDVSSSDSEGSSPVQALPTSLQEISSLNDSIHLLIEKYKQIKCNLDLSQ